MHNLTEPCAFSAVLLNIGQVLDLNHKQYSMQNHQNYIKVPERVQRFTSRPIIAKDEGNFSRSYQE